MKFLSCLAAASLVAQISATDKQKPGISDITIIQCKSELVTAHDSCHSEKEETLYSSRDVGTRPFVNRRLNQTFMWESDGTKAINVSWGIWLSDNTLWSKALPKGQNNITINFDDVVNEIAESKENGYSRGDIVSYGVEGDSVIRLQREGVESTSGVGLALLGDDVYTLYRKELGEARDIPLNKLKEKLRLGVGVGVGVGVPVLMFASWLMGRRNGEKNMRVIEKEGKL